VYPSLTPATPGRGRAWSAMATRSAHRAGSPPDDPASAGRRLRDHPGTPRPALRAPGRRPGPIQPSPRRPGPSGQDSLAAIGL